MNNYILKNENAIYYECGYSCDNACFLRLDDRAFFFTDSRYFIEATQNINNAEVFLMNGYLFDQVGEFLKKNGVNSVAYDPISLSVYDLDKLSSSFGGELITQANFSQKKRIIKTKDEIEILRQASKIGANSFDKFADFVNKNPNLSEKELYFHAKCIFENLGETGLSFEPIAAINQNAAKAHALPSEDRLKFDDLLLLDAGVKYKRYCSDRTRTAIFDGKMKFDKEQKFVSSKQNEVYEIVKQAQILAINSVKEGMLASDVDKAARDFISKNGFGEYFLHSTGHGVGLDIHELPVISKSSKDVLKEGMVFSIEPGVYLKDEFGVRIEDVVVVTKNGCEIL